MARRSYQQYCSIARTLDLIGERWTLLLVRELLTGPRRFGDLLDSLPGMGTALLAARLKHLQEEGLVEQVTLPPPARTPAYGLTTAGAELEPAVLALARWGLRWTPGEPSEDEAFRPGWAVLGMQAMFDPVAGAEVRAVYEFRVLADAGGDAREDVFHARVDRGTVSTAHGPAQAPDVVVTAGASTFARLADGRLTLTDAARSNGVTVTGDLRLARKLRSLFRRPPAGHRGH